MSCKNRNAKIEDIIAMNMIKRAREHSNGIKFSRVGDLN
jgi:hypothetical protein